MAKKTQKAQKVDILVGTLVNRLEQLLRIKGEGAQAGNLIKATEKLLDNYAARITDKDSVQVTFIETDY